MGSTIPQKLDCYSSNLCTLTMTGHWDKEEILFVFLNWYAELLMDNLVKHGNAAVPLHEVRQVFNDSGEGLASIQV